MAKKDWAAVKEAIASAKAMHFDLCHKIYLSMDDEQVAKMESYGYESVTPDYDTLRKWYKESCGLRFVNAVYTNAVDPNRGFVDLIPQL